ncbi:hypothetical protein HNY73_002344 [Argiope bruennichi]|uniref:Uncharacterized protein n=1 Tax=Argiope bruennichi TaxID=94029 RepID=A0A8T0FVP8_ARGBR|nr:hypothetical protein HNY73_002344 [Argiope bruennichi]
MRVVERSESLDESELGDLWSNQEQAEVLEILEIQKRQKLQEFSAIPTEDPKGVLPLKNASVPLLFFQCVPKGVQLNEVR